MPTGIHTHVDILPREASCCLVSSNPPLRTRRSQVAPVRRGPLQAAYPVVHEGPVHSAGEAACTGPGGVVANLGPMGVLSGSREMIAISYPSLASCKLAHMVGVLSAFIAKTHTHTEMAKADPF